MPAPCSDFPRSGKKRELPDRQHHQTAGRRKLGRTNSQTRAMGTRRNVKGQTAMLPGISSHYNCKACALRIPPNLKKCPHCSEPNPYSKEQLGPRVDYLEYLDPTFPKTKELPWYSRNLLKIRPVSPWLIGLAVAFLVVDFFWPSLMVSLLALLSLSVVIWLSALYAVVTFVLVLCTVAISK